MEILQNIWQGLIDTSFIEWVGFATGLLYLICIANKKVIGWVFGVISAIIYTYLSYDAAIYNEAFLQFFYIIMGFYGWFLWRKASAQPNSFIVRWSLRKHLVIILFGIFLTILLGYLLDNYTNDPIPYLDSFSTVFSLLATFMDTKRVLDNWLYWIIIDTGLIFLYGLRGFHLTGLLYLIYTIIAIFAYIHWYKSYKLQET